MKATFTHSSGSPVFIIPGNSDDLSRIFGGTYLKQRNAWMYPAYPPLLEKVQNDFQILKIDYDDAAKDYLSQVKTYDQWFSEVQQEPVLGPFPNYAYQKEGIAELLYNYRWLLRWGMGTGKTKVVVETLNKLRCKALIIGPVISLPKWANELNIHSNGTLLSIILTGTTRQKKIETLRKAIDENYDVLLTTYETARLYGNTLLSPTVTKAIKHSRLPIPTVVQKLLLGLTVNDALAIIESYQNLIPLIQIRKHAATLARDLCLFDFPYEMIVLDESHRIKNTRSMRTKAVAELCKKAPRRYLLTGTVTLGNPLDVYPQLQALAKYICPENYHTYKLKFCAISPFNEHVITGYKNMHILSQRINSISSEKRIDDCVDLPELRDVDITFELTPAQLRDYNSLVCHADLDFGEFGILKDLNGGVRLNKLLQICSGFLYVQNAIAKQICDTCEHVMNCVVSDIQPGTKRCARYEELKGLIQTHTLRYPVNPKLTALEDLLEDLLENPEEKVVIWTNLDAEMDDIATLLRTKGYSYVRIDGSTTSNSESLVKVFNEDTTCRVYLGQESTGISIDLVSARYAVYYSRSWSLDHWLQSRAREYRIGQTRKTVIYRLCAKQSVEVQQLLALDAKQDVAKMLTKKVNCAVCDCYKNCLKDNITPWSSGCVYKSKVRRETVTPEVMKTWK